MADLLDTEAGNDNPFQIRIASTADIPQILRVGKSATEKFGSIPELADLAEHEETSDQIQAWITRGHVYVAVEPDNCLIGFIAVQPRDHAFYIDEISVSQNHQGKGVGNKLLRTICEMAVESSTGETPSNGCVSLVTYAEVPWNGPWYQKRGFKKVNPDQIGPWHVDYMSNDELERSLNRPGYRRCCMLWQAIQGV